MDTESSSFSAKALVIDGMKSQRSLVIQDEKAEKKVQLMMDCMKYHLDDVECLKKSLLSLSSLCSSHDNVKDYLRENGCLQFILNLFTSCENTLLKETTLFCLACAVDQNVYSQRYIISQCIFDHIHTVFQDKVSEKKLHQTAAFVISCIAANNSIGQLNCKKSSCLTDLINLFRLNNYITYLLIMENRSLFVCNRNCITAYITVISRIKELIPKEILSGNRNNIILGNVAFKNADLFTTICNAICASVNNPRNEENQDICAKFLLHPSLLLIQKYPQLPTVHSILNLMAVLLAGNTKNQEKMRELNGIHVLCDLLRSFTSSAGENINFLKMAVTVTSTLDSCLLDNASNSEQFGSCGGMKYLVSLLHLCGHRRSNLLQVILTVAHATDCSSLNQNRFTECGGLAVLVPLLSEPIEEELMATVKYVLQTCVPDGSGQTKTINDDSDTDNESFLEESYQPMEPGWLSEKLGSILQRLDNIENGGYKAPSIVGSFDVKAFYKKKVENRKEIQQTEPAHHCHKESEEEDEEEEENNELPENSNIEAPQLLPTTLQSKSEKTKTPPFKKPLPVTSEIKSKSGVKETQQKAYSESSSVFSEFDILLTAKAKSYPQNPSSVVSRSTVPDRLADNNKKGPQSSVSNSTANSCTSFKKRKNLFHICPGGAPPNMNGKLLLTSRNYNKVIESNPNVCSYHRQIRIAEREWIRNAVKNSNKKRTIKPVIEEPKSKKNSDVFDYISSSDELDITPPEYESDCLGVALFNKLSCKKARRKAVKYSEEEINNLKDGLKKMGPCWKEILNTYKFHSSRTATDLAYKYKQMKRKDLIQKPVNQMKKTGFSLCEERRLERGVKKFGPCWTQIWKKYKFGPDKVPEDLRLKWRVKNK